MTIIQHLEGFLDKADSILAEGQSIEVRLWKDRQSKGMGIVCTVGMSNHAQTIPPGQSCPSIEPRTELLAFCHLVDASIIGQLLFDLSLYPFQHEGFIFWWHTLPLGRPLVAGSNIEGVLLTFPPYGTKIVTFLVDQTRRDLVWVVPICRTELEFCRRSGVQAFEQILQSSDVDLADLHRSAVV